MFEEVLQDHIYRSMNIICRPPLTYGEKSAVAPLEKKIGLKISYNLYIPLNHFILEKNPMGEPGIKSGIFLSIGNYVTPERSGLVGFNN